MMSTTPKTTRTWPTNIAFTATKTLQKGLFHSKSTAPLAKKFEPKKQYLDNFSILARRPKWVDKEYREGYMEASVEQGVAWQIKINRELRGLTQVDLAKAIGTGQSAISRAEDPTYGSQSLDMLMKIANAFDCALSVKFISFSQLAFESERLGELEQYACSYTDEARDISWLKKR